VTREFRTDRPHRPRPGIRPIGRFGILAAVLLISLPAVGARPRPVEAQQLRGRVLGQGSGSPASGAFLTLFDSAGGRADAALSGKDGAFALAAPAPGTYRVRIERIGYRTWTSDRIELGAGATVSRTFVVPIQAVSLENLRVRVGDQCRGSPGSDEGLLDLWSEARKALRVTAWSEKGRLALDVRRYERDLDPKTRKVVARSAVSAVVRAHRAFTTLPADTLSSRGYLRGDTLLAPDADVLLSPSFASDHCFGVDRSRQSVGLVGLAFRPVPGRKIPDVRGVLWVDRGTAALRTMDFTYTGLVFPAGADSAGGHLAFDRLPNGAWLVSSWSVQSPARRKSVDRSVVTGAWGTRRLRQDTAWKFTVYHVEGGEVVSAGLPGGRTVLLGPAGYVSGVAYSGAPGHLLPGAVVRLRRTSYVDTADAFGGFRLGPVPPGDYDVVVRGGADEADVATAVVHVRDREEERLELVARAPEPVAAATHDSVSGAATLMGIVRDSASGQGLGSVRLRVLGRARETLTTAGGGFRFSNLPTDSARLEIQLTDGRADTMVVALQPGGTRFVVLEVTGGPRQLPGLKVAVRGSARRLGVQGFYQRMTTGSGYYVTSHKIEQAGVRGALRALPGVRVRPCYSGGRFGVGCETISIGQGPRRCATRVYVNGLPMTGQTAADFVLNLDPTAVAGIEAYPSAQTAPIQYRDLQSDCGVLLVWTK